MDFKTINSLPIFQNRKATPKNAPPPKLQEDKKNDISQILSPKKIKTNPVQDKKAPQQQEDKNLDHSKILSPKDHQKVPTPKRSRSPKKIKTDSGKDKKSHKRQKDMSNDRS